MLILKLPLSSVTSLSARPAIEIDACPMARFVFSSTTRPAIIGRGGVAVGASDRHLGGCSIALATAARTTAAAEINATLIADLFAMACAEFSTSARLGLSVSGSQCRPYGTRFLFIEPTPDLRPGLLYAAPTGLGVGWRRLKGCGPMDMGRRTSGGGCPHMSWARDTRSNCFDLTECGSDRDPSTTPR